MYIKELSQNKYDVVIVGSGPAGISLALGLAKKSQARILIIESGDMVSESKTNIMQAHRSGLVKKQPGAHKLSEVEASGDLPREYFALHSQRMFGGTSSVWSGFCTTLEERSFLNTEWPITYEQIMPYYEEAADILELPNEAFQSPVRKLLPDSCAIRYRPYYLSTPVRFGDKYHGQMSEHKRIDVLLNNTCTNLHSSNNAITGLSVRSSSGHPDSSRKVTAGHYILACGGIGNARLMQLGNVSPELPVGNGLMDHPHIYNAGNVELDRAVLTPILGKGRIVHALQLSDEFCLKNGLLSFTVSFSVNSVGDRVLLGERKSVYISPVTIRAEMLPQTGNGVVLGDRTDYLGQARAKVNFKFNYQDAVRTTWKAFAAELLASGIGRASTPPAFDQPITGGGHIIGTTRMGDSAVNSVVDGNCKVYGKDNLYIVGSSIFPASAAANPTFSIVAFSLRLADRLATKI